MVKVHSFPLADALNFVPLQHSIKLKRNVNKLCCIRVSKGL